MVRVDSLFEFPDRLLDGGGHVLADLGIHLADAARDLVGPELDRGDAGAPI
jgi:predicted dehydrogenase